MRITVKKITNAGIFLSIALGIFFPMPNTGKQILPYLLGLLLLSNFLKIEFNRRKFFRKELLYFPVVAFMIAPVIIYFVFIYLPIDFRIGLFIMAITPAAIASPVVVDLINGDRELAISHVLFTNLLSPFVYSVMLYLFFSSEGLNVPVVSMLRDISLLIIVPFILSRLLKLSKPVYRKASVLSKWYSPLGFLAVVFTAVSSASEKLRTLPVGMLLILLGSTALLAIINFMIGFSLSRDTTIRRTLAVGFCHRNTSMSIWIGLSNFSAMTVLPMVSYLIFHHIINGIIISRYHHLDNLEINSESDPVIDA